jgi:hypothetical protein
MQVMKNRKQANELSAIQVVPNKHKTAGNSPRKIALNDRITSSPRTSIAYSLLLATGWMNSWIKEAVRLVFVGDSRRTRMQGRDDPAALHAKEAGGR